MTILCGTDFSDLAWEAAQAAAMIAARSNEVVDLVHVMPKHASAVEQQLLRVRLDEAAERLVDRFHGRVEPCALLGETADVIASWARESNARLVVLSSRGTSKPAHWLRASVAEDVAAASPAPILVVRDSLAIQEWTLGQRPLSVMVGVGLDATSKAALSWAHALREIGPCALFVTQIVWPFSERDRVGMDAGVDPEQLPPGLSEVLLRELHEWAGDVSGPGGTSFAVHPGWGRVDTHLTQRAADSGVDLLVVGMHQRSGLARLWRGSTSSGAVHYAACNVACIPSVAASVDQPNIQSFRSVLIPTDFSPVSKHAITSGYGMLRPGGIAHLLHVVTSAERHAVTNPRLLLEQLVSAAAHGKGLETRVHVVTGESASAAILQAAARLGVDAICMGTRRRSMASELVLGSQAQEVLRQARSPVLLVTPESEG